MSKGDIAKEYFEQGYNCSQSVALAFADEVGMDSKLIARLQADLAAEWAE